VPAAPTQVTASQDTATGNSIVVNWVPSGAGTPATGAIVQLYQGSTYIASTMCQAGCTSAMFRHLNYEQSYVFLLWPTNSVGSGNPAASPTVTLHNNCTQAGVCVTVDATSAQAAVTHSGAGFLHSLYPVGTEVAQTAALHPRFWRGSPTYNAGTYDYTSFHSATQTGAQITLILSDMWYAETYKNGGATTPWSNWTAYSTWVANTVRKVMAVQHVDYWDIQNEPGAAGYYNATDFGNLTPQNLLQQFRVAYNAIKSVNPSAQILGPSMSHYADYPGEYNTHELDLVTFLNYAVANRMKLAAISWHEVDDTVGPNPGDYWVQPQIIQDHVAKAQSLIAQRPSLGGPQVFINEYGLHMSSVIPGWAVGNLAALETSHVGGAGLACWSDQSYWGATYNDCANPTLDGLFNLDGTGHRSNYYVYQAYAGMAGAAVPVTTSDDSISGLATANPTARTVQALVGRHLTCLVSVNPNCGQPSTWVATPVATSISVKLPWAATTAQVTVSQIPATWQIVNAPTVAFQGTVAVNNGVASIPIAAFADGDAYTVSVTG
jgi:hypothetical protein